MRRPDRGSTGTLRALAVTTTRRSEALPDIPTVAEFVPGYEASTWYGIGAPKNTPSEIVDNLNKEINVGLADSKLRAWLADLGGTVIPGSPAAFHHRRNREMGQGSQVLGGQAGVIPGNLTMAPPNIPQRPVPQILPALARRWHA
jgi:tripartite-type tricarboxylate transporter receptor subunit TctC